MEAYLGAGKIKGARSRPLAHHVYLREMGLSQNRGTKKPITIGAIGFSFQVGFVGLDLDFCPKWFPMIPKEFVMVHGFPHDPCDRSLQNPKIRQLHHTPICSGVCKVMQPHLSIRPASEEKKVVLQKQEG